MVIKRMRLKAIFSDIDDDDKQRKTYGLKTFKCPPQVKELANFENDLLDLVKNVEFDDNFAGGQFQKQLQKDIGKITKSKKTLTAADKTSNMYRLTKEEHDKLLHNAVTTTYNVWFKFVVVHTPLGDPRDFTSLHRHTGHFSQGTSVTRDFTEIFTGNLYHTGFHL